MGFRVAGIEVVEVHSYTTPSPRMGHDDRNSPVKTLGGVRVYLKRLVTQNKRLLRPPKIGACSPSLSSTRFQGRVEEASLKQMCSPASLNPKPKPYFPTPSINRMGHGGGRSAHLAKP